MNKNTYIAAFAIVVSMAMLALSAAPVVAAGDNTTIMDASGTAKRGQGAGNQNVYDATLYWQFYDDGTGAALPPATITLDGTSYTVQVESFFADRESADVELDFGVLGKLTGTAGDWKQTLDVPSSYAEAVMHLEGTVRIGTGFYTFELDGTVVRCIE